MNKFLILISIICLAGCATTTEKPANLKYSPEDTENWKQCQKIWGSELSTPNFFVNHFLFLPNKKLAEKAASEIRPLGFDVTVDSPDGSGEGGSWVKGVDDKKEWHCYVSKDMVPNLDAIMLDKQKLKDILKTFGGHYESWGLEWNGDNP